jgi:hypothetical protein
MTDTRPAVSGWAFNGQNTDPVSYSITKAIYDTAWDGDLVVRASSDGTLTVTSHK